jgi:hypothetical protein
LARYRNSFNPGDVIIKWMSNKSSFDFYCLCEELSNPNLNAELINQGIEQSKRLERLNTIAKKQYSILQNNNSINDTKKLDNEKISFNKNP